MTSLKWFLRDTPAVLCMEHISAAVILLSSALFKVHTSFYKRNNVANLISQSILFKNVNVQNMKTKNVPSHEQISGNY
mgnify:CR=1 FL=1